MSDEELIHQSLLYASTEVQWNEAYLRKRFDKEDHLRSARIFSRMIHENLLERFDDPGSYITSKPQYVRISHLGLEVLQTSGYVEYHKRKLIEEKKAKRKAELELSKLENEVTLTKWQYVFFWIGSGMAFILFLKEIWTFLKQS